jgi:hypothetical protein
MAVHRIAHDDEFVVLLGAIFKRFQQVTGSWS